jgi:branched-chain amino acid transport system permease protein
MKRWPFCILIVLAALSLPMWIRDYWLYVIIIGLYYAVLSSSWSLLAGQIGIISFAHAAFAATGAYTSALLVLKLNIPIALGMVAGAGVAAIVGLGIGALTLRMSGPYLTLTSLAFAEILRIFLTAEYKLTRGSYGLNVPLLVDGDKTTLYYIALGILSLTLLTLWSLLRSRWGLFLLAMREDEDGAAARGVNTVRYRQYAFMISSGFAGLSGAFLGHVVGLVSPQMAIIGEMGMILAMSVFGGMESILGAAVGAIVLQLFAETLREFTEWRLAIFSGLVLLILRFAPEGLIPWASRHLRRVITKSSQKD